MENTPTQSQHMTLIVIGGALLAAIVVGLIVFLMPNNVEEDFPVEEITTQEEDITSTITIQKNFDTSVLDSSNYTQLDRSLFVRGVLPVIPPTGTGKTNLFR